MYRKIVRLILHKNGQGPLTNVYILYAVHWMILTDPL